MNELQKLHAAAQAIVASGRRGLVLTVVGTRGSTYRRTGARVVVGEDGALCGAISGGCLERDVVERFKAWAGDFTPRVITYDSSRSDDIVFGLGLGCRGELDILVEPFDAEHPPQLPEPVIRRVAVFGGGPDAEPVVAMANAVGFTVDHLRPRDVHPEQVAAQVDLTAYEAAIVMTHNYLYDLALLRALLASPMRYIGLLGPKQRGEELLTELGGVRDERIHNPIGLDLGGETPEEIALSIVAELQTVLNGRSGRHLRESAEAIHAPRVTI